MTKQIVLVSCGQYVGKHGSISVFDSREIDGIGHTTVAVGLPDRRCKFPLKVGETHNTPGFGSITLDEVQLSPPPKRDHVILTIDEDALGG